MKLSQIEIFECREIFLSAGLSWNADAVVRNECRIGTKNLLRQMSDGDPNEIYAGGTGVCGRGRPRSVRRGRLRSI